MSQIYGKPRSKPFEKTCLYCKKVFLVGGRDKPPKKQVYCSAKCSSHAFLPNRIAGQRRKFTYINCDNCGKKIHKPMCRIRVSKHHFCSNECKTRGDMWLSSDSKCNLICRMCKRTLYLRPSIREKWDSDLCGKCRKKSRRTKVACRVCNKPFELPPNRLIGRKHHYCSYKCLGKSRSIAFLKPERLCYICGSKNTWKNVKGYAVWRYDKQGRLLCNKCNHKMKPSSGAPFKTIRRKGKYVTCTYCGKTVYRQPQYLVRNKRFYCSSKCYKVSTSIGFSTDRVKKVCEICKKPFETVKSTANRVKTCSLECGYKYRNHNYKSGNYKHLPHYRLPYVRNCLCCGRGFIDKNPKASYCSQKCMRVSTNRFKTSTIRLSEEEWLNVICKTCGKRHHEGLRERLKRFVNHYCSKNCYLQDKPSMKDRWKNAQSNLSNPSKLELRLLGALIKHNIKDFIHGFSYDLGCADFFIFPNIIVECDGDYHHARGKFENPDFMSYGKTAREIWEKDLRKTMYLWEQKGFHTIRLSETSINKDINNCMKVIEQVRKEKEPCIYVVR